MSIIIDFSQIFTIYYERALNSNLSVILSILIVLGTIITPLLNKLNSNKIVPQKNNEEDKYKKLEQLKNLLDNNVITQEEFEKEKTKILNNN